MKTTPCVIFDLDGTLADTRHRNHLIRLDEPDWEAFFLAAAEDTPHGYVAALASMVLDSAYVGMPFGKEMDLVICTGRPDTYRDLSETWLRRYNIPWDKLIMRAAADRRPNDVVKLDMLTDLRRRGFSPVFSVDDEPASVRMWRANGVPCLAVDDSEHHIRQHHLFSLPEEAKK